MESNENSHYLWELLDYLRLNTKSFSSHIGLDRPDRIYHVIRGRNKVSKDLAKLICDKYPDINFRWVATGEGAMLKDEGKNPDEVIESSSDREERLLCIIESQQRTIEKLTEMATKKTQAAYMAAKVAGAG